MPLLIALAAVGAQGVATPARAQSKRKCELHAHVVDRDPPGINVRATPANQGKVIGVLKLHNADDEISVDITAENSGWFRIKKYEHFSATKSGKVAGFWTEPPFGKREKIDDE
jgi:hypothetical protein